MAQEPTQTDIETYTDRQRHTDRQTSTHTQTESKLKALTITVQQS